MDKKVTLGDILYLSYDGLTDPLGQSQILPYLIGLSNRGYSITIISFEKRERYKAYKHDIERICQTGSLQWKPLPYHKNPPVLSSLFDIFQLRRTVKELYHKKRFSIVHCRSYITSLIGLWMKRTYKVKFVFDMRGFWADERVEGGLWKLNNPVYKLIYNFFKRKEKQFISQSDHVVSLTNNARREIQSWQLKAAPISVIPTCVDLNLFDPERITDEQKARLREQTGIGAEDTILIYLGSWGTWYETDRMLQFFRNFKKIKPLSKFLIVTQDDISLGTKDIADAVIVASAPRAQVPLYISIAHAALFFIKPSYSKKASSATKMGEIMAMNVPIIANRGWGDIEEIFNELAMDFPEPDINLQEIESLLQRKETRIFCKKRLSLEMGIGMYADIYDRMINEQK